MILPISPAPSAGEPLPREGNVSAIANISAQINSCGGAIRFDEYMATALYGEHGFYTSGTGRAGRRGDFITSPEVGPLFGSVLARALDSWWEEQGAPEDFYIYEVGAGPGTLARSILAANPRCLGDHPARYVCVELSAIQRASHPTGVTSVGELPSGLLRGVVIANELLDNMPFRLLVNDGQWGEAWVTFHNGSLNEIVRPIPADILAPWPGVLGARVPVQHRAADWVREIRSRLHGRMVLIDYTAATTAELAQRPWRDWLRTYVGHGRGVHYLHNPGEQDITTDVCLDQIIASVGEPDGLRSQSQFLQRWGIDELVAEGRRVWTENAARPDLAAMKMRSRISEAEALVDPTGLGSFTVIEFIGTESRTAN